MTATKSVEKADNARFASVVTMKALVYPLAT